MDILLNWIATEFTHFNEDVMQMPSMAVTFDNAYATDLNIIGDKIDH